MTRHDELEPLDETTSTIDPPIEIARALPSRLRAVIDAVIPPRGAAILIGERGMGKAVIALEAATFVGAGISAPILELSRDAIAATGGGVVVVPDLDHWTPMRWTEAEAVLTATGARIIATASRLVGAAERFGRDPRVARIVIGPLDIEESAALLASLLGAAEIDPVTVRLWHSATGGHWHALWLLAVASERRGLLRRSRGVVWSTQPAAVPEECTQVVDSACSAAERRMLELIALAEPVTESAVLRGLDAVGLASLHERGLVVSRGHRRGVELTIAQPLLAAALRQAMPPARRAALADELMSALIAEHPGEPVDGPRAVRIAGFAFDAGRDIDRSVLAAAFEAIRRDPGPDPVLAASLARRIADDPLAEVELVVGAVLFHLRLATAVGDRAGVAAAVHRIRSLIAGDPHQLDPALRVELRLALVRRSIRAGGGLDAAEAALDELASGPDGAALGNAARIATARVAVLAESGRLRAAIASAPSAAGADLETAWLLAPARVISALIALQRGRLEDSIRDAESVRFLTSIGDRARSDVIDLDGLCAYIAAWSGGSAAAGHRALLGADEHAGGDHLAIEALAGILIALEAGRWQAAAGAADCALSRLDGRDVAGIAPVIHAALALALAALDEPEAARRAIAAAEAPVPGLAQAFGGTRRILVLWARQWLRGAEVIDEARATAAWAARERIELVELKALQVLAVEMPAVADSLRARAHELADATASPVADALAAHLDRIAEAVGATDDDGPEVRMLAELGIWTPLPPGPTLSPREREIALIAALGYSSRFIAARFHLSTRTVETHLAHVFAKLGVQGRDELREWFARHRRA